MPVAANASNTARTTRVFLLTLTIAVAVFNGLEWSPFYDSVAYVLYLAMRGYPMATAARMTSVAPLAIAVMTLLIAGIPAAIYERIRGLHASTPVSLGIWLVAAVLLTVPTIRNIFGGE
jgi:exosortase/archaeosortase